MNAFSLCLANLIKLLLCVKQMKTSIIDDKIVKFVEELTNRDSMKKDPKEPNYGFTDDQRAEILKKHLRLARTRMHVRKNH